MRNAVIVGFKRSPFTMAKKGELAGVRPEDILSQTIDSLVNGKIVMVPFFEKNNMKKFLYNFNKEIIYTSEEEMKKKIKSLIGKKISFPLKKQNHNKTIEYYYGKPAKVVERYVGFLNS